MVGINVEVSFQRMKSHRGVGGGGYFQFSIMAYTRRLRPKGVSFFTCRFEVYEREEISLVEVYERAGA